MPPQCYFSLPPHLIVSAVNCDSPCAKFAVAELTRLLHKLGTHTTVKFTVSSRTPVALLLGESAADAGRITTGRIRFDGFKTIIAPALVILAAKRHKGLLNSVYAFAEHLGFTFLLPGEKNEFLASDAPRALPIGESITNPRTPFRGVFATLSENDFSAADWMKFYAKLRFNAVCAHNGAAFNFPELGIRFEAGGHGLAKLLPRELFAEHPEYFRLFQPEDFHGKRTPDANFCTANADAWAVVGQNLAARKDELNQLHAAHLWADDLPAGGWCDCDMCRAFTPADQNMIAMRKLAQLARKYGISAKIPVISYHDSMYPSRKIEPDPERNFLLFAPRERCYGHALHDSRCALNRRYLAALKANRIAFRNCGDAHTFEYYCDQILFRGMYPFLPNVILGDYLCYSRNGIEAHMTLQVGGCAVTPDYNLLLFAAAGWNRDLFADHFTRDLAQHLCGTHSEEFRHYLDRRGEIFETALKNCHADPSACHLDYRWLPEDAGEFRKKQAAAYKTASRDLAHAAAALEKTLSKLTGQMAEWLQKEVRKARFESASFHAMSLQQDALCHFADGRAHDNPRKLAQGISLFEELEQFLPETLRLATAAGIGKGSYYERFANDWLLPEIRRKTALYRKLAAAVKPAKRNA